MRNEMMTITPDSIAAGSLGTADELLENFRRRRTPRRFEPLVLSHIDQVRRIIFRITLCPDDTEDLVQETFIRAYEKIDQFRGESSFSTWLCRIGVNLALSFLKKTGKRGTLPLTREIADRGDASPGHKEESGRELERIHAAIAQLPEKYRAALVLSAVEEMDTEEIANVLNCANATVYWRLHRARKILAQRLEVQR